MLNLSDYDMSADRGFLCRHDATDVTLSGDLAVIRDVAMSLRPGIGCKPLGL